MKASTADMSANQWWEVAVSCPVALEDSVYWQFELLSENGGATKGTASSRQGERITVTAYFPAAQFQPSAFAGLKDSIQPMAESAAEVQVSWRLIDEEDWATSWKSYWQAEAVGDRLLINPAWMKPPTTERTILTLDPGSAFGTGGHATTQLCLRALEQQSLKGATIADIGCGSGILSIVSILYGAAQAYAVDVDPLAVKATRSNADLNGIASDKLQVQVGSVWEAIALSHGPVDGIVCNILAEIIVALIIPQLSELASPTTWCMLSGILTSKADWVSEHLTTHGWQVTGLTYQDEWCAMAIQPAQVSAR